MNINIAKCGCDCSSCPTYKDRIKTSQDRTSCSTGWKKYLGIKLSPEKLRPCDGCSLPDNKRKVYYLNCKIRKCAILNGAENCAYCAQYPCNELLSAHNVQRISDRNEFIRLFGKEISAQDFDKFIKPYCGLVNLNMIRNKLKPEEYVHYVKHNSKIKFSPFPQIKNSARKKQLIKIYSLLTSVCIEDGVSYARFKTLEASREQVMKILWAMCSSGRLKSNYLELDAAIFMNQKIHGMMPLLKSYFEILQGCSIQCEIIPTDKKRWLTPMGGLRREGWIIRMSSQEINIALLQQYVKLLYSRYNEHGIGKFNSADMSVFPAQ